MSKIPFCCYNSCHLQEIKVQEQFLVLLYVDFTFHKPFLSKTYLYLHALYIVKREFCRLKILQEFSRESWIIFIYSTYIQKDCFSFCTVLESATRWRYIQGNISPFHSFCPLAPSISQKLKLFFWPILSFGDRANSANAFHREPYWSKRQAPFLLSTMKQKITWIRIWILLISCVK